MSTNAAIEMLDKEHKLILLVVLGLHGLGRRLREGKTVELALLREAIVFMREFADRCHHEKEEKFLFPAFVAHGVPLHGCPLDALLHDHKEGRRLVGELEAAVDNLSDGRDDAGNRIVAAIDAIERLYPEHIWKEDAMVFPMAERLFQEDATARLRAQFEAVETHNAPGSHEHWHAFAARLSAATRH